MSQHSSTTVYCMNSVVFHFSTVCGILQFFDAVLRYWDPPEVPLVKENTGIIPKKKDAFDPQGK